MYYPSLNVGIIWCVSMTFYILYFTIQTNELYMYMLLFVMFLLIICYLIMYFLRITWKMSVVNKFC